MRVVVLAVALALLGSISLEPSTASAQTADSILANKKAKRNKWNPKPGRRQIDINRAINRATNRAGCPPGRFC
jgi:hypothetical protein